MSQPTPPMAPRRPHRIEIPGQQPRDDDWYWLRDRDDPAVRAYLEAENAYADELLAPTEKLQEAIFQEIKGRVVETDADAPVRDGAWWYWSRTVEGQPYGIACRRHDPERRLTAEEVLADARAGRTELEEVILDQNELAAGSDSFALGVFDVSPDHRVLAYATDLDGDEKYALRFRDLTTGEDLADRVEDVTYGSAWSADGRTLFYVLPDAAMRPFQVWRHALGTDAADDVLVHEVGDERFFVSVGTTRSRRFVVVDASSKMTSVALSIPADRPTEQPTVVLPLEEGVEYDVEHAVWPGEGDVWLVRHNRPAADGSRRTDFALDVLPVGGGVGDLRELLPHRPGVRLVDTEAFADHVVVTERTEGLDRLRVLRPGGGRDELLPQPDAVYTLTGAANPEWDASRYRFGYMSLVAPQSTVEVDLVGGERRVVRQQPVVGYDPARFRSERLWAQAADGARIPISVVARADVALDGTAPCLLYGYGSYEVTVDPWFSVPRLSLLERGVVFAIAHVRGGGELGRSWYEQGRLQAKPNTFTDFVACAEHLVATGWADRRRIAARGGSAGGLLMGAVTNLRPDLWRAVVAEVPFVDVVTTMSDASLPLTVTEWEEWGNPVGDPAAYRTMLSYSPYDNLAAGEYPAMFVTAGLNDPRVGYWEPAKWVARIRTLATGDRPILLRTELDAGHGGPSGRYAAWRDEARVAAFVLAQLDVEA
ncbi:prolyl oligopeptidase family serine peptidase [Acidimicrobiaceae bacterium USS-CC1]|uniref:Prolyl oligopeptidase family serine peptidase n=1 Tax=Acidiferrimicrobium australe TaxID=2664430 RepID=A0ABW9QY24_9ACTN|nr:prolyl oligopeptidase family serine peptidase [Acidiferrimicrobium australe]